MDYKKILDEEYKRIVQPLEKTPIESNTLTGMFTYMELMGEAMENFGIVMSRQHQLLTSEHPEQEEEIQEYIKSLKSKMTSTYKP